jgi:predicted GNAT superfamily acetyltransferase
MPPDIIVRPLRSLDEFHRCVQIAREVWGEDDLETEPFTTFVIAGLTGGQVLGAFDGDRMVGFTKAFVGYHEGTPYLHSHMTGVLASHRDRRVGRHLKLFQREDALRRGFRLIEWTFDPLETKNAHFNINRLGAICRRYIPNFYGITTSPLHRGMPTDRLLVEWHLDSKRVIAAINDLTPDPRDCPAHIHLPPVAQGELAGGSLREGGSASPAVLSSASAGREEAAGGRNFSSDINAPNEKGVLPAEETSALIDLQSRLRAEFTHWFDKGYAVTGVRFTRSGVDYCLSPYSDF